MQSLGWLWSRVRLRQLQLTKTDDHLETPEPQGSDRLLSAPADGYETMNQPRSKSTKTQVTTRSPSNSFLKPWSDELVTIPSPGFYRTMLLNPGIMAGLSNTFGQSLIVAAFDTTLPLFLSNTFGWGSMPVGLIFLGLQGPIIILGPVIGRMRDRLGCRLPTVLGWVIVAPSILLLALVGRPGIPRVAGGFGGEVLVVVCIAGIGLGFLLIRGSCGFQVISVAKELEDENSGIFGPNGANSKVPALLEMAVNVATLLGPLISGSLLETLGYFWLNVFMGESPFGGRRSWVVDSC